MCKTTSEKINKATSERKNVGIVSKERVKKNGEVFTPDSIVNDMVNMLNKSKQFKNIEEYLDNTYLEPTCGDGAILVRILDRKLEAVQKIKDNGENWEEALLRAVSSIYGVDITADNVVKSKRRMLEVIETGQTSVLNLKDTDSVPWRTQGFKLSNKLKELIKLILDYNIQCGNLLTGEQYKIYCTGFNCWTCDIDLIDEKHVYRHKTNENGKELDNWKTQTSELMLTQWKFKGTQYINRQCTFNNYRNYMLTGQLFMYHNIKKLSLYCKKSKIDNVKVNKNELSKENKLNKNKLNKENIDKSKKEETKTIIEELEESMNLNFETAGINFNSKGKPDEIATPLNICKNMADLFDYADCNKKIWMDMYCKTGNTLDALKEKGVDKNNIVAICDNPQSQMFACRKLYGQLLPEVGVEINVKSLEGFEVTRRGQVYLVSRWSNTVKNNYQDAYNIIKFVILKEMEKTMSLEFTEKDDFQINNIIMNPPYNNDMYIDFVLLAKQIATEQVVAITPAKWQAKGGAKNEEFRKNIVPYMREIVVYRDTHDIFDIDDNAGMTYYVIDNNNHTNNWIVSGKCTKNDIFNFDWEKHTESELKLYSNKVVSIINKCNIGKSIADRLNFKRCMYTEEQERGYVQKTNNNDVEVMQGSKLVGYMPISKLKTLDNIDKYKVSCAIMIGGAVMFNNESKILGSASYCHIGPNQVFKGSFPCLEYFNTEDECKYFESYMMSKLMGFLFFLGVCGATMTNNFFKYVPDPVNFDHIFTDEELYKKYNLTDEEINIIESVIKERK